jgi:hypothetical protein
MIAKAVIAGARAALEAGMVWTPAELAELRRAESEARWVRDFRRAAQHYIKTGTAYVPPPTPEERLLTAIFGAKK